VEVGRKDIFSHGATSGCMSLSTHHSTFLFGDVWGMWEWGS